MHLIACKGFWEVHLHAWASAMLKWGGKLFNPIPPSLFQNNSCLLICHLIKDCFIFVLCGKHKYFALISVSSGGLSSSNQYKQTCVYTPNNHMDIFKISIYLCPKKD